MIVTVAPHLTIALRAALTSSVLHKTDPRKSLKGKIMVFETALLRNVAHSHEVLQVEYHGGLSIAMVLECIFNLSQLREGPIT